MRDDVSIYYDYLVLSPGIGFTSKVDGYTYDDKNIVLTVGMVVRISISQKLNDLKKKSTIIISAPDYPYRCPPAPYRKEQVS